MPQFKAANANEFVEQELDNRLRAIERSFSSHAISLSGPLVDGVDDLLRQAVEKRRQQRPMSARLSLILTTEGGYIETVDRMVATLRKHYQIVDFVVPKSAYSAGTEQAQALSIALLEEWLAKYKFRN